MQQFLRNTENFLRTKYRTAYTSATLLHIPDVSGASIMNIVDRQEKYPAVSKKLNRNDEQRLMRMKRILIMLITLL